MNRPVGPLPVYSTDDTWDAPGKTWDGEANKVALSAGELAQGIEPGKLSAEKLAWKLHEIDLWLQYLDGIEAKNWDSGAPVVSPSGPHEFSHVTGSRTYVVPSIGQHVDSSGIIWNGGFWVGDGSADAVVIPLQLTDGDILTRVDLYVFPGTRSGTPGNPPEFSLNRKDLTQYNTVTVIAHETDPTVHPAYDALHSFGKNFLHTVDTSQYAYLLALRDESGANSAAGLVFANVTLTIAEMSVALTAYDIAPALYTLNMPAFASKAVAWNEAFRAYYAVVVRDHVTTLIASSDGRVWEDVVTGLSAPTQSTVDLTFTVSGSGVASAGDAFTDGLHVWLLDADQTWSGSGSKGPYSATVYSPGLPAYYGPIRATAGVIDTKLTPNATITDVTNASDATPGTDPLDGDGSSLAVDALGGMLLNPTGTLWYRYGPGASGGHSQGEFEALSIGPVVYRVIWSEDQGVFFAACLDTVGFTVFPALYYVESSNTSVTATAETLPNASSYTGVDQVHVAASSTSVVAVAATSSASYVWTAGEFGGTYTEHGSPTGFSSQRCIALEWSPTDRLFIAAMASGNIYTSSGGVTWQHPGTAGVVIQHMAILGGSWLVKGTFGGVDKLSWSGDQGQTWQVYDVPWTGGNVVSLVALEAELSSAVGHTGCFGILWVGDDGVAKLYRSMMV